MDKNKKNNGSQMRISDAELDILKKAFAGNVELLKLLRKVFLPEIDPTAPLGQQVDLWMTVDLKDLTAEQAMVRLWARNMLITHVEQQLMMLNILAGVPDESVEDTKKRLMSDSAK